MVDLYTDAIFERHETGQHPECPARLASIRKRLDQSGLLQRCRVHASVAADPQMILRVHTQSHLDRIEATSREGGGRLDPDTVMSEESADVANRAAGTAAAAVDAVLGEKGRKALCLVRPPGHHALANRAMGFCLYNNVAVAAAHARAAHGLERVLIVDWDVHHGNGTQDIFYEDGQVYFLSAHRWPFYPGTGDADETGAGAGLGATRNLPLQFGISRPDYRSTFAGAMEDFARRCRPQLVLVSAGFDAHRADPIGSLGLETEDFASLTELVDDVARTYCEGRLVSFLEGGYDLQALAESVESHLATLIQRDADDASPPAP
ncbi:Histone deacetylase-like amidohydrolase [Maioricimonas rarisocia]|uniref:Histone deacetylase-like amidohydrolase n=1 Tax=Maioricimonas rarisocia TaxID=2528026 RepID=A0A517Z1V8_9PLAN|nr:histone deacetylase [Maioricimonas rarisocia]QDU36399.1 Histone deacetylase-like amidohydrolase [Maioricimonas rarisocia]